MGQLTLELLDYPKAEIWLHVDSDSERKLRINACAKEPETVEWIESLEPSKNFFDIGACVGAYSILAAKRGLRVFAFEAASFNARRIHDNLQANGLNQDIDPEVSVGRVALSDHIGELHFDWSSTEPGAASHRLSDSGEPVPCVRLDGLVNGPPFPHYIKLDVDGTELQVIQGARDIWKHVEQTQVEIDDSLPDWRQIIYLLCTEAGFKIQKWSRHNDGPISNVLFGR